MSKNVNVNLLYHWGDKAIDDLEKDYIRIQHKSCGDIRRYRSYLGGRKRENKSGSRKLTDFPLINLSKLNDC